MDSRQGGFLVERGREVKLRNLGMTNGGSRSGNRKETEGQARRESMPQLTCRAPCADQARPSRLELDSCGRRVDNARSRIGNRKFKPAKGNRGLSSASGDVDDMRYAIDMYGVLVGKKRATLTKKSLEKDKKVLRQNGSSSP